MPNKPTTLRESDNVLTKEQEEQIQYEKSIINKAIDSHSTELLRKIEGLKKIKPYKATQEFLDNPYQIADCEYNQVLNEVINLINQEK